MANDQLQAFLERHSAAWNSRDGMALSDHHADDGVILSPMFARVEGRSEIVASYASLFAAFPDWELHYHDVIFEGSRIAAPFHVTATHRGEFMGLAGTGKRGEIEGVSLFTLNGDLRVQEERRIYDFTGLLAQLGVVRIKPSQ